MSNSASVLLLGQIKMAHGWLEDTLADVTNEQAHWVPDGKPNPIGAQYGHVVSAEDFLVSMATGQQPLMMADFAGKTGLSEMQPIGDWAAWSRQVRVDINALREWAHAVQKRTETAVAAMSDDDLAKPFDMSAVGMGMQTLGFVLNLQVLNNITHAGEISCLKGLQGMKGYRV